MSRTTDYYKHYIAENPEVKFWLDEKEKGSQTIRQIDLLRFAWFVESTGKNPDEYPMSAKNLNEMENWYIELARKAVEE